MKWLNIFKKKAPSVTSFSQDNLFTSLNTPSIQENAGWVYMCVKLLATNTATLRYDLVNSKDEIVNNSTILNLLDMPNESFSFYDFAYIVASQLNLSGNSYWLKIKDNSSVTRQLVLLNPHSIVIKTKNSYEIDHYLYYGLQGQRQYLKEDILHFKLIDPADPVRGKSPVSAFAGILQLDDLAEKRHMASFRNQGIPSGILTLPPDHSKIPDISDAQKTLRESFQGVDNYNKVMVVSSNYTPTLTTAKTEFTPLSISPNDLKLLESRFFSKQSIQELFGISGALLGKEESSNRATAEAQKVIFIDNHVKPLMELIVRTLNRHLIHEIDASLKLDLVDPVPENRAELLDEVRAGVDRFITPNEGRIKLGYPPSSLPTMNEISRGFGGI
ncbi:MAG: phage portal protein [Candidatus Saccharibacteria bacterium]|nr:phage portal protein [Candidatus Saccharibacteria bacterium]